MKTAMTVFRFVLAVGAVLIATYVAILVGWMLTPPNVSVTVVRADNALHINVKPNFRIHKLSRFRFWEEGADEYAWVLDVTDLPAGTVSVIYGQVREGSKQLIPAVGIGPPRLNGSIRLAVGYIYDDPFPSYGGKQFAFVVTGDGEIGPVTVPENEIHPTNGAQQFRALNP